jgi:ligand-binding sensor domain-containing protein
MAREIPGYEYKGSGSWARVKESSTVRKVATIALSVLVLPNWHSAVALDTALDVNQYAHAAWRTRQDFISGQIKAIAQTTDGYLWLGTDSKLFRFDGVRTIPWMPPQGASLPDTHIRALLGARDGTLWIGTWAWPAGRRVG